MPASPVQVPGEGPPTITYSISGCAHSAGLGVPRSQAARIERTSSTFADAIALKRDEGDALWAFGGLAVIKTSREATDGRVFVVEMLAPRGAGSPLHVHHREDEWFYVTDGELTFWVGGQVIDAPAGSFVYGPGEMPHTFDVVAGEAR